MLNQASLEQMSEQIIQTISAFHHQDSTLEVRIINTARGICSGYFKVTPDSIDKLIASLQQYLVKHTIYFTVNPVNKQLHDRSPDKITPRTRVTTKDDDISSLDILHVDLDPIRATDTASTNDELERAKVKALEIVDFLTNQYELPKPIISCSGNGYNLDYRLESLANDTGNRLILKNVLKSLDMLFSDEFTKVDTTTYNPSRIIKLFGSYSFKGDNSADRPYRQSFIEYVPEDDIPVSKAALEKIASLSVKSIAEGKKSSKRKVNFKNTDMNEYLSRFGVQVSGKKKTDNATLYVLEKCPWNQEHTNKSAYVMRFDDGGVHASCHHDSCRDKNFRDFQHAIGDTEPEKKIVNWENYSHISMKFT